VASLRRRGRPIIKAAEGTHLVPPWPHPDRFRVRQGIRPGLDRGTDLCQTRRADPVDLPDDHPPRPQEREERVPETDYAALLDAAHQQLGGPIVLVWDNLTAHHDTVMQKLITARSWLTVYRFPTYAPELNPVEGVWANLKRGLGNLAALVKTRLKKMQYRPASSTPSSPRPASPWQPTHPETLTFQLQY
jgi:hypothetical protein